MLRPELIPGYQAWTSVPERPLPRWENLINTFQKSNSYHLLKICIRSQNWYFEARSINSQKVDQRQKFNPSPSKMASRLHLLGWRRTISSGTYLVEPRVTKATSWMSFNFKLLHRRMPTNDFFLLKIGREEYFSEKLIYLFLVLPWICYILFLEKRDWLASRHSSDNRQIQLIEHHCTGLKARASFYKILVSIKVMSPASTVWQAKMDEISPNFVNFRA